MVHQPVTVAALVRWEQMNPWQHLDPWSGVDTSHWIMNHQIDNFCRQLTHTTERYSPWQLLSIAVCPILRSALGNPKWPTSIKIQCLKRDFWQGRCGQCHGKWSKTLNCHKVLQANLDHFCFFRLWIHPKPQWIDFVNLISVAKHNTVITLRRPKGLKTGVNAQQGEDSTDKSPLWLMGEKDYIPERKEPQVC